MNNETAWQMDYNPENGRSALEIVGKVIFAVATTALAARNLARLRQQPRRLATYQTLASTLIPTFPIAELLIGSVWTFKDPGARSRHWTKYTFCGELSQRALPAQQEKGNQMNEKSLGPPGPALHTTSIDVNEDSIPLSAVAPESAERQQHPRNLAWFLELSALILFAFYTFISFVVYFGRVFNNTRTFLDDFIFMTTFSRFHILLMSTGIKAINTTWRVSFGHIQKFKQLRGEPEMSDLFLGFAGFAMLAELQIAFTLAVVIQSITLLWMRQGATGVLAGVISCDNPMLSYYVTHIWAADTQWMIVTGKQGAKKARPLTLPCHGYNDISRNPILESFASTGFCVAFICAWWPALTLFGVTLAWACRRTGYRRLERVMSPERALVRSGFFYLFLSGGLGAVTIWNLYDRTEWEPWMRKDLWAEKLWIF